MDMKRRTTPLYCRNSGQRKNIFTILRRQVLLLICVFCAYFSILPEANAAPPKGPLVIVTSFPEAVFSRFKEEFINLYPEVKIYIRSKKTSAGISFVEERAREAADIFWASAPDAFEVLKQSGSLLKAFDATENGTKLGDYPLDDPEGFYKGFAISGYGLIWNIPYLLRNNLPVPKSWNDLKQSSYTGHIGFTAPSRSGTAHVIIETILQHQGWEKGWASISEIAGNLVTITARSFGVLDGVRSGRFGIGPVIDFFGLSAKALGAPVDFSYPENTVFVPANIAIVKRSTNPIAARAFIDYLLSDAGQQLLFEPEISRLPIRPSIYRTAPTDYPNPFNETLIKNGINFNSRLSWQRYHLVNSLFDVLATYRAQSLRRVWQVIHQAETLLINGNHPELAKKINRSRQLVSEVPVSKFEATDVSFTAKFKRHKPGLPLSERQLELEKKWRVYFRDRHNEALLIATEVLIILRQEKG